MASTVVVIRGVNEFADALVASSQRASVAARTIVTKGSLIVSGEAKKAFRGRPGGQMISKSGRTYYSFKAPYQAVPPTPTSRSGKLKNSIGSPTGDGVMSVSKTIGGWQATFGTAVKYAPYVEFGTKFMEKEPFLRRGLDESKEKIQILAEDEWAKAVG